MDPRTLATKYLSQVRLMQLATSADNQPWICILHFYADRELNLYWISLPDRHHSKDIESNAKCAVSVMVHEDTPSEKYIIGISAEGIATRLSTEDAKKISPSYRDKLDKDPAFIADILAARNAHVFYRFTPTKIVLFDTKNFPQQPKQEITL